MQKVIRNIFIAALSMAIISILYFLMLTIHTPFFLIVPVIVASVILIIYWYLKVMPAQLQDDSYTVCRFLILAAGLILLERNIYLVALKHGGWDAWAIWNYHALFLADGAHWKMMFHNHIYDHPDYPLFLPSLSGFFIRLFSGRFSVIFPFIFSVIITVSIPVLIFTALSKKNLLIATLILFLMVTDKYFAAQGVSQYADTPLAFFILCTFIALGYAKGDKNYIAITTAFLGCCMWTKNEGSIIAFLFLGLHANTFFNKKNISYALAGIALPLTALWVFKVGYAPANDMVSRTGTKTLSQVFMADRYKLIYTHFRDNLNLNFFYVKIAFFIYVALLVIKKRLLSKSMWILILCMLCYAMVYVLTFHDLEWQLRTSQDRLMHQLMPAMIYIIALEIIDLKLGVPKFERKRASGN